MSSRVLLILLLTVIAAACGSSASTSTSVTSPASTRCTATVSLSTTTFGPAGGNGTLQISVARECAWKATSPVAWISLTSAPDGQGDGSVSFSVAANAEPVQRQAALTAAERQAAVMQQPAPCQFAIGALPQVFDAQGGSAAIDIRTHPACNWTARSESGWATVAPATGRGDAAVTVTISANTGPERPVVIVVADQQRTATQTAAGATPPPAPTPGPTPTPAPGPTPGPTPTPGPGPTPAPSPTPGPGPTPTPGPTPGQTPTPSPGPTPTPGPTQTPGPTPGPTPIPGPTPSPTPTPTPTPTGPTQVSQISLSGDVENLTGGCPTWRFEINKRVLYTTALTTYQRGPCTAMRNSIEVDVDGWVMSDGTIRADRIRYGDDD